jgi:hypothetical protein
MEIDVAAAKGQIELQKVTFTGGIHYDDHGHVYIKEVPGPKYVGPPEPAIDAAWDELLKGKSRSQTQIPRI